MKNLDHLNLINNRLEAVPAELGMLQSLQGLFLQGNRLTGLPREIGELRSLERAVTADEQLGLHLENNFFPDPYPALIGHGQPSSTIKVLSFLRGEFDTAVPDLSTDARVSENLDDPEEGDQDVEEALRQRPAAFGFGIRRGMIDALPEHSEIIDFDVAGDIYAELSSKTQSLSVRLTQMNADPRVQHSANRLLGALGSRLEEIRPGVLLSRARSIEADRNAFDSEEGRRELFPEAIAMMDDVLISLQDMLATFPIVRRIEAERLALSIQADENILGAISAQMNVIAEGASGSDVVTESAVAALQKNDAAIADARTSDVRAGLVADQLLVHRNFVSETLRLARDYGAKATTAAGANLWKASEELKDLGGKSWQEVKNNLPEGVGAAARIAPVFVVVALIAQISLPIAGLGGLIAAFKPLAKAIKDLKTVENTEKNQDSVNTSKSKSKK